MACHQPERAVGALPAPGRLRKAPGRLAAAVACAACLPAVFGVPVAGAAATPAAKSRQKLSQLQRSEVAAARRAHSFAVLYETDVANASYIEDEAALARAEARSLEARYRHTVWLLRQEDLVAYVGGVPASSGQAAGPGEYVSEEDRATYERVAVGDLSGTIAAYGLEQKGLRRALATYRQDLARDLEAAKMVTASRRRALAEAAALQAMIAKARAELAAEAAKHEASVGPPVGNGIVKAIASSMGLVAGGGQGHPGGPSRSAGTTAKVLATRAATPTATVAPLTAPKTTTNLPASTTALPSKATSVPATATLPLTARKRQAMTPRRLARATRPLTSSASRARTTLLPSTTVPATTTTTVPATTTTTVPATTTTTVPATTTTTVPATTTTTVPATTTTTVPTTTTTTTTTTTVLATTTTTVPATTTTVPATTTSAAPATAASGTSAAASTGTGGHPPPAGGVWLELRQCESGDNYQANTGNGFYGAYQFSWSTWSGLGFPGRPDLEPYWMQDEAAQRLQAAQGWSPWPACSAALGL